MLLLLEMLAGVVGGFKGVVVFLMHCTWVARVSLPRGVTSTESPLNMGE
jgi:hypothetical protein